MERRGERAGRRRVWAATSIGLSNDDHLCNMFDMNENVT